MVSSFSWLTVETGGRWCKHLTAFFVSKAFALDSTILRNFRNISIKFFLKTEIIVMISSMKAITGLQISFARNISEMTQLDLSKAVSSRYGKPVSEKKIRTLEAFKSSFVDEKLSLVETIIDVLDEEITKKQWCFWKKTVAPIDDVIELPRNE